jgi:hypothetical protein
MRRLAAVLALGLVSAPLLVAPSAAVALVGAAALALCALGILVATPLLVGGMVLALGEYALALRLAGGAPHLGGAVLFGVVLALLLEAAEFGRRAHQAAVGPGVVAAQLRSWAVFGALAGAGGLLASAAASVASASVRLPWAAAIAAAAAAVALVAVAFTLSARRASTDD